MYALVLAWTFGFLIGWFFRVGMLIAASSALTMAGAVDMIAHGTVAMSGFLILFAALFSLQSGFLIGAYIQCCRDEQDL